MIPRDEERPPPWVEEARALKARNPRLGGDRIIRLLKLNTTRWTLNYWLASDEWRNQRREAARLRYYQNGRGDQNLRILTKRIAYYRAKLKELQLRRKKLREDLRSAQKRTTSRPVPPQGLQPGGPVPGRVSGVDERGRELPRSRRKSPNGLSHVRQAEPEAGS